MTETKNTAVNVEQIMSEIREDIRKKGLDGSVLSFEDVPVNTDQAVLLPDEGTYDEEELYDNLEYISSCYNVSIWRELTASRKGLGKIVIFFKKVIRKLIRFFVEPIVEDQNRINMASGKALNQIRYYIAEDSSRDEDYNSKLEALSQKISEMEKKISDLENENQKLKNEIGR